ncbi:MAG: ABC transporter ATP-binding protein [Oscillospiraceae bacterium]|nr:ABC transporter ATP-binding protein [Oscillospiraceae bacterium]
MLLEMKNICKDYIQGKKPVRVLKDVCLQMDRGDYLAIMGPSGSGKTTLMNLIGCLDVPTRGTYFLDGMDLGQLRSGKLAEVRNGTLGFVFQSFHLLPKLSAVDNVALPLLYAGVPKKERRARAEEALRKMGMGDRLKFRPNQLSGGQCQRVAIARAIVTKPKLLLADEPTGALDSASGKQIMDIFDELNADGVSIIMITHEHEVANRAKRICHLRDGVLSGGVPEYEKEHDTEDMEMLFGDDMERTSSLEDTLVLPAVEELPEAEEEEILSACEPTEPREEEPREEEPQEEEPQEEEPQEEEPQEEESQEEEPQEEEPQEETQEQDAPPVEPVSQKLTAPGLMALEAEILELTALEDEIRQLVNSAEKSGDSAMQGEEAEENG